MKKEQSNKPHLQVAAGLILRKNKILIAKRPSGTPLEGLWEFPGGKQEKDESLKNCLIRELKEELGVTVKIEKHFLTVDHEYEARVISLHFFFCVCFDGEPKACEEQDIKWITINDFDRYHFLPPDLKVIAALRDRL